MTRTYLALYAAIIRRPKYRRLSIPARAALLTLWCDGATRTPEAVWPNRAELADVLDLDGYGPDVLAELEAAGWIDTLPDGRPAVHDWDEHQRAYDENTTRAYEAARKADWRNRAAKPSPPTPPLPEKVGEKSTGEERIGSGIVPDRPGQVRDNGPTKTDDVASRDERRRERVAAQEYERAERRGLLAPADPRPLASILAALVPNFQGATA